MKSDDIGDVTEAKILSRLLELGYTVSVPWGKNQRYDLVVDTGSELIRAQCKTGRLRDGVIIFNLYSHSRNGTKDYKGQVDWFLVYCPDTDCVYKVLESEVGISQFSLRTEPSKANTTLINWAIDYKL